MPHILRAADRPPSRNRTVRFEGAGHDTGISFFAVDNDPGQGPVLHTHPYAETWMVQSGKAQMRAGDAVIDAGPGDIVVVEPNVPHAFTNVGTGRLVIFCIHDSPAMIQTDLE